MRPVLVIIADVITHEAFQMLFVEYDHMIEQFAPTASDEPFRDAILPRASEAGPFRLDAEALDGVDYVAFEIRGPIKDQVFWERDRKGRHCAAAATPMRLSGAAWHQDEESCVGHG